MNNCKVCNKWYSDPLETLVCCSKKDKVVTSKRCELHNTFYTIPGGSCKECVEELPPDIMGMRLLPEMSDRKNEGKVQTREIDPAFILGIGEVLTKSRDKYPEGNWMKETKLSTPYESAMRHLAAFWAGDDVDKETLQSHLLHCATNLMFLHYHMTSGKGIDDRLFKKGKK